MFEKPQYLTQNGLRRLSKAPFSDSVVKKKVMPGRKTKSMQISPEAAQLIASALKVMLKS